jgi:regulator of PEP synthase PpsR (kinase-PPPase family)
MTQKTKKQLNLHLISDSTGETLSSISRAVLSQFQDIEVREFMWYFTRTERQVDHIIAGIRDNPGFVLYTVISENYRQAIKAVCDELKLPCIGAITEVIKEVGNFLKIENRPVVGRQHEVNQDYFRRIDAMNYTMLHDDGNLADEISVFSADIVILGASRTSKSPVSMFLGYKGYKVANIPFVNKDQMPAWLTNTDLPKGRPIVVGLVIDPTRLEAIRKNRMASMNMTLETDYTNLDKIYEELQESRKYFSQLKIPIINVTQKSVEEIAVNIISILNRSA